MRILNVGFVCLVFISPVLANDASFKGDGATVFATKETRVRMANGLI